MTLLTRNGLGIGGALSAIVALGVAGCGDDFSEEDCKATRSCTASGGEPNAEAGGPSSDGQAGGEEVAQGGASTGSGSGDAGAGDAGSGALPACTVPEDCDNGDPADGQETCGEGGVCADGNPPPTIVSVSPDTEASDVELDTKVVLTFSEPLDPATVETSIRILDGDTVIDGALAHEDGVVTFTPSAPLALLAEYEVRVGVSVTDAEGAALLEEYSSTFQTRDGAWTTTSAITETIYQIADTLPMTATGDALVSWINITNLAGYYCPTSARWFNSGKVSATSRLTSADVPDCRSVTAGANASGVAAVSWQESDNLEYAQQYRSGTWSGKQSSSIASSGTYQAVAVSPAGAVSLFRSLTPSPGMRVRVTSDEGTWQGAAKDIGGTHVALGPPRVTFNSLSHGFAVWRAEDAGKDEILAASYTPAGGWTTAIVVLGSLASDATATNERGEPAIAMDGEGGAMALWVRESPSPQLVASRYTSAGGWSSPLPLSGSMSVSSLIDAPGLVFDGHTYVAAWTGSEAGVPYTYSARYDMELEDWGAYEPRTDAGVLKDRMPRLGVDSHQNLLLTWLVTHSAGGKLVYARYNARAGEWSEPADVDEGIVKDPNVATYNTFQGTLGVASNGFGALMWGDAGPSYFGTIRLASFY